MNQEISKSSESSMIQTSKSGSDMNNNKQFLHVTYTSSDNQKPLTKSIQFTDQFEIFQQKLMEAFQLKNSMKLYLLYYLLFINGQTLSILVIGQNGYSFLKENSDSIGFMKELNLKESSNLKFQKLNIFYGLNPAFSKRLQPNRSNNSDQNSSTSRMESENLNSKSKRSEFPELESQSKNAVVREVCKQCSKNISKFPFYKIEPDIFFCRDCMKKRDKHLYSNKTILKISSIESLKPSQFEESQKSLKRSIQQQDLKNSLNYLSDVKYRSLKDHIARESMQRKKRF